MAGMAHAMGATLTGKQKLKFVVCGFCNLYFASHTTTNCKASSIQRLYLMQRFGHVASAPPSIMTKLWYCGTTRWSHIVTEQKRSLALSARPCPSHVAPAGKAQSVRAVTFQARTKRILVRMWL